jgi:hypothetical protein
LVSILPSDVLLKPRKETAGAHRPNGVFVAAGKGIRRGLAMPSLSILDIAPLLFYTLGLPVPEDLEGHVPAALFEPEHLHAHPIMFDAPVSTPSASAAPQFPAVDPLMEAEVMGQLRALGYME